MWWTPHHVDISTCVAPTCRVATVSSGVRRSLQGDETGWPRGNDSASPGDRRFVVGGRMSRSRIIEGMLPLNSATTSRPHATRPGGPAPDRPIGSRSGDQNQGHAATESSGR
jgi:hypothetical protein